MDFGLRSQLPLKQGNVIEFEDECVAGFHVVAAVRESLDECADHVCKLGDVQLVFALRRCGQGVCGVLGVSYRAFGERVDYKFE
ncbi:hypothetical protein DEU38_1084 [Rhodococcus sp. AG1013]|nr:hypothetical protein DEU38_1084 [Rhodococcus sp. AG1013]